MTVSLPLQLLGYAASLLIVTSMLMRSIVRLRMFNLAGAATFSIYGFLIGATPVGVLNLLTASINVVQLVRLRRRREIFRILEVRPDAQYVSYFLDFQMSDIRRFVPGFRGNAPCDGTPLALFVLRDLVPAGILLGCIRGERLEVSLDYASPPYRDMKIGRYLFHDEADFFRSRGIREIVSPAGAPVHSRYLEAMGFEPSDEPAMYRLRL
ncbi:MAG TPA: hypothetical protein VNL91_04820 [Thermoanaerobaculia bacterium]|nr:hypothetical protein [Thermoanaerobaculia bacterium]